MAVGLPNWEQQENNEDNKDYLSEAEDDDEADNSETDPFINLLTKSEEDGCNDNVKRKRGGNNVKPKRQMSNRSKVNPVFCEPTIMGVEPCQDPNEVSRVQTLVQSLCDWKG